MAGTLCMLAFAVTEMPWRDTLINNQHIFNEVLTYFTCIFLLFFNSSVSIETRLNLGYGLIALVSVFLVYNGVIMMRKVTRIAKMLIRKWRWLRKMTSLRAEAVRISFKIK